MFKNKKSKISFKKLLDNKLIYSIVIISSILMANYFIMAWVPPTQSPPGGTITGIAVPGADCADDEVLTFTGGTFACKDDSSCPGDMADVGGYCIDVDQNPNASWQAQNDLCQSEGKRLCSLGEWIAACNDAGALGLNNMLDANFEFVDEYWVMNYTNGNYYSSYVSAGSTACGRVYYSGWACSNSTCYDSTAVGQPHQGRCCK